MNKELIITDEERGLIIEALEFKDDWNDNQFGERCYEIDEKMRKLLEKLKRE